MSKLINLFYESDKLKGCKNYKSWKQHMESTLIYSELRKDICNGNAKPNKPTNAGPIAKWELKDEKTLALIKSSVNEEKYVHIENAPHAWSTRKKFKENKVTNLTRTL
jgi:hypothetical protein